MKIRKKLFVLLMSMTFVACESVPTLYMKLDDVKYVNKFPKEKSVKDKDLQVVCDDISGCCDLFVADSILVGIFPEADYFWKAYSLKDNTFKMSLIRKGHGRNEFPYAPHSVVINKTSDSLLCSFLSNDRRFFVCDLGQSITQNREVIKEQKLNFGNKDMTWCVPLNDSLFYTKHTSWLDYSHKRMLFSNGSFMEIPNIQCLNNITVEKDINTLSFLYCLNNERDRVAEAMMNLNQINIYSFDGSFQKTICIGNQLMNVGEVDHCSKANVMECFGNVISYSNYFVALYHGVSTRDYYESDAPCSLMIFDWEGNPLLKLNIPFTVPNFGISGDGTIYLLRNNIEKEVILKYKNINSLLD